MKKFLVGNSLFFFILLLPLIVLVIALYDYIPAPRITNSYSLNEKMKFVANRAMSSPEIISIGSSIAFNNLDSKEITTAFGTRSYLNMASWGLRMRDSYWIINQSLSNLSPKRIIIASSATDFNGPVIQYNINKLDDYLDPGNLFYFQINNFDPKYFFKRLITNSWYYNSNEIYKSLKFDNHGAVLLNDTRLEIIESRWMQEVSFDYINSDSYVFLDSLAKLLADRNIELIFVQSPVREEIRTPQYRENIAEHMSKINTLLKKHNHFFIDCTSVDMNDSLFSDSQHLNSTGARVFTQFWLAEYFKKKDRRNISQLY